MGCNAETGPSQDVGVALGIGRSRTMPIRPLRRRVEHPPLRVQLSLVWRPPPPERCLQDPAQRQENDVRANTTLKLKTKDTTDTTSP